MSDVAAPPSQTAEPRWRPISAIDRRLIGVLIEKAKTTPDVYPMSVNSLRSGANQKNNRFPLMELEADDVEESLGRLRQVGAVTEIQGGGRVPRFRHHLYEWLGVDKIELAVMGELLLRGAQTEGDLRGRAARMDPIPDLNALRPILTSLTTKGLIVSLTPQGRGHVLTHALYEPRELEKLRAEFHNHSPSSEPTPPAAGARHVEQNVAPRETRFGSTATETAGSSHATGHRVEATNQVASRAAADERIKNELAELRQEVDQLRADMERLRRDFEDLSAQLR